ncbi:MAG: cystathionine beta-lyase [Kordiimonadaceae bacterium]|jgi:cysteine-S-conjugate beta-lyase|nr:cystathionine beta-lyase [Kordiimonadaceae bacterium]
MHRDTKLMHYGRPSCSPRPANPPVVRASTILHDTVASYRKTIEERENDDSILSYGRRGTTTAHELSNAIMDLEGGDACFLFPTGIAAIVGALSAYVKSGDHLLIVDTIFPATRNYCEKHLRKNGVSIDYIPWQTTDVTAWLKTNTKALLVESPASQTFEIMDLPKLCENAHKQDIIVIADNTYGSSWLYQPLKLGCDVSVIAGTKYLSGHADVMMGAVVAKGRACAAIRSLAHITGQTLGPDDAYACLRGIRTLSLRMERHGENSIALANWFGERPEVTQILHPALPDHPGHEIWQRDSSGCNGLLSVVFNEGFEIEPFLDRLKLFSIGASWGGFESLALIITPQNDRQFSEFQPSNPMVRFHAGLENLDDLINDLDQAFLGSL